MTTAILAQNEAASVARAPVTFSLPNVRVLALTASFACHVGLGALAYSHASPLSTAPQREATHAAVEISIATVAPDPVLEPPTQHEAPAATHPPSTLRTVVNAVNTVSTAQAPSAALSASAPAAPLESAEPAAPRFVMQAPVVVAGISAPSAPVGRGNDTAPSAELPFAEGQVDSPAKLQSGTPPTYTAAAEAAGVEVELPLEVVIDGSGAVQSARTLQHVGYGLDEAAVASVRRYRFSPAHRAGKAVAVRMRWVLRFQLR